jgi:hypothetical protein
MSDPRGKAWLLTLSQGRQVTIGAGVDEDPGGWVLFPSQTGLLRWLTVEDIDKIIDKLHLAREHLAAHPPGPKGGRRRK